MTTSELRELRARNKLTQEQAARICEVTLSCWRNWEAGRRKISPITSFGIRAALGDVPAPTPEAVDNVPWRV